MSAASEDDAPWHDIEDRRMPPIEALDVTWQKRWEVVCPKSILAFLMKSDARRAETALVDPESVDLWDGFAMAKAVAIPLFVKLQWYYRRCEWRNGVGYCIRVVSWTKPGPCGLLRRRYSGMSPWPTVPQDDELKSWLLPDVVTGIPRS